jgi:hypothetical protein
MFLKFVPETSFLILEELLDLGLISLSHFLYVQRLVFSGYEAENGLDNVI